MATTAAGTPYVEASDLVAGYPAVSLALANHIDTLGGLKFVSGGALSGTTVNIDNVFTADYLNYKIMISATSSGASLTTRLRAGGSSISTANYQGQQYLWNNTSVSGSAATAQTSFNLGTTQSQLCSFDIELFSPFASTPTNYMCTNLDQPSVPLIRGFAGSFLLTTSCSGISFESGSALTGQYRIYGYANS